MDADLELAGLSLIKQYLKAKQALSFTLDTKSGDLAEAMPFLLQVINRQAEEMATVKHALGLESEAVWNIAVRILKDLYLAQANDSYRVLGLNPWCGITEAKERHRNLIRLFHPDRGMISSLEGEPDFAAIINSAYTVIYNSLVASGQHDVPGKINYQQKLSRQFGYKIKHTGKKYRMAAVAAALGIYKLTPRVVWLALITFSVMFIAQKYWNSQTPIFLTAHEVSKEQAKLAGSAENAVQTAAIVSDKMVPPATETKSPESANTVAVANLNQSETAISASLAKDRGETIVNQASSTTQSKVEAPENVHIPDIKASPKVNTMKVNKIPEPVAYTKPAKSAQNSALDSTGTIIQNKKTSPPEYRPTKDVGQQTMHVKVANSQMEKTATEQSVIENRMSAADKAATVNVAVNKDQQLKAGANAVYVETERKAVVNETSYINAVARPPELSNEELGHLIKKLVASYNKGDLESFMQLLEEDVVTEDSAGKNGLRQSYASLFKKTSQREMQLKSLNWQRNGEVVTASPKYEVSVTFAATSKTLLHRGVLQFEVVRREGRPVFHAFYHLPEESEP